MKTNKILKIITLLTLSFMLPFSLYAGGREAAEMYREGRFQDALSEYNNLLKTEQTSPFLYYNIGNSYYKLGRTGMATAYYMKAFELAPRDRNIRENLALALENTGQQLVPAGVPAVLFYAYTYLSAGEIGGVLVIVSWALGVMVCFWFLKKKGMAVCIILFICLLAAGIWRVARERGEAGRAVIISPVAELRSGPGEKFPVSVSVEQGYTAAVQDSKDNWLEISISLTGQRGWIDNSEIIRLEEI
ncbi:SH3 domain-containing protein [Parelusimicrobium proximum]|uniref:tetratricopeptide repeat protein n=1 Tax=Parelusimicrobium proximum TaxID=3228953 RepID=UPI003D1647A4